MSKLIIVDFFLLFFTLTACFEKKSELHKKIAVLFDCLFFVCGYIFSTEKAFID